MTIAAPAAAFTPTMIDETKREKVILVEREDAIVEGWAICVLSLPPLPLGTKTVVKMHLPNNSIVAIVLFEIDARPLPRYYLSWPLPGIVEYHHLSYQARTGLKDQPFPMVGNQVPSNPGPNIDVSTWHDERPLRAG